MDQAPWRQSWRLRCTPPPPPPSPLHHPNQPAPSPPPPPPPPPPPIIPPPPYARARTQHTHTQTRTLVTPGTLLLALDQPQHAAPKDPDMISSACIWSLVFLEKGKKPADMASGATQSLLGRWMFVLELHQAWWGSQLLTLLCGEVMGPSPGALPMTFLLQSCKTSRDRALEQDDILLMHVALVQLYLGDRSRELAIWHISFYSGSLSRATILLHLTEGWPLIHLEAIKIYTRLCQSYHRSRIYLGFLCLLCLSGKSKFKSYVFTSTTGYWFWNGLTDSNKLSLCTAGNSGWLFVSNKSALHLSALAGSSSSRVPTAHPQKNLLHQAKEKSKALAPTPIPVISSAGWSVGSPPHPYPPQDPFRRTITGCRGACFHPVISNCQAAINRPQ